MPLLVMSRPATRARPEIRGAFFSFGTETITAVRFEVACPVPAAFVAVTTTSNVWPASPPSRKKLLPVAPPTAAQAVPLPAQRSHWKLKLADVFHVPEDTESAFPAAAVPEMTGGAVAAGTGMTTLEIADAAKGDAPFTLVALTVERTTLPTSAL